MSNYYDLGKYAKEIAWNDLEKNGLVVKYQTTRQMEFKNGLKRLPEEI